MRLWKGLLILIISSGSECFLMRFAGQARSSRSMQSETLRSQTIHVRFHEILSSQVDPFVLANQARCIVTKKA